MSFLDNTGLTRLWSKCKATFAPKSHNHNDLYYTESEVDSLLANIGGGTGGMGDYATLDDMSNIINSYIIPITPFASPTITASGTTLTITNNDIRDAVFYLKFIGSATSGYVGPDDYSSFVRIESLLARAITGLSTGKYAIVAYVDGIKASDIIIYPITGVGGDLDELEPV